MRYINVCLDLSGLLHISIYCRVEKRQVINGFASLKIHVHFLTQTKSLTYNARSARY